MTASKLLTALFLAMLLLVAPLTEGFSLTAMLTRRGNKPAKVAPSQALQEFNAQMATIIAEERREHYYPYVQQTSAFLPVEPQSVTTTRPTAAASS